MAPDRVGTPYPIFRKNKIAPESKGEMKNDVKEYCKEMLANSMLTGVPQIVSAPTTRSKVFKTFVVLSSFTGFLYQTSAFLVIYFSYPTLVDLQITTPPFVDLPSLTVCNRNGLRRTEFCRLKPEKCHDVGSTPKFCEHYPETCENGRIKNSLVPKFDSQSEEVNATSEFISKVGHEPFPLISSCDFGDLNSTQDYCKNSTFKSFMFEDLYGRIKKCYIINALWNQARLNLPQVPTRAVLKIVIDLEPDEYFRIDEIVTGQLAIHSPWNILNPFSEGFTLKPKKTYLIRFKEDIKNLLPYPYQTNCTDYIKQWRIRGKNGPLSKEMCIEECILNQTMDNCQCVLTNNLYPHNFNFCSSATDYCTNSVNYTHCFVKCSPACHDRNFAYEVQEEDAMSFDSVGSKLDFVPEKFMNQSTNLTEMISSKDYDSREGHKVSFNWNRTVVVLILFKRTNVNVYRYRAKYDSIELFSFLGGFVGIWLGVSLIALLDFLESLATFAVFLVDKVKGNPKIADLQSSITSRIRSNSTFSTDSIPWAKDAKEHNKQHHLTVNHRPGSHGYY